ncbi:MAG: GNAT family N-acetyltransferase [Actinomycetes bacterium]
MTIPPTPLRSPIRLEIRHRLDALASTWDELVDQQTLRSPFLSSWWVDHATDKTSALLCCFDGADLVGGAAFQLEAVGSGPFALERVRCLGQGTLAPDHLDLIASPHYASEVLNLVLGWLLRPGSRIIDLDGLAATGALAQALRAHQISSMVAPFTKLPADGAEYLAGRAGKVRSTIVRTRKRFVREGVQFRRVTSEEMPEALDRLAELHEGRWSEESAFLNSWEQFRAAALAGGTEGAVVIHELVSATNEVIATELDLRCGNRLAFYQAGRRTDREWRGSGSVLRADILDWACAEGFEEYDLLRGDEPYKSDWSENQRQLVRCRLGVGLRARTALHAATAQQRFAAAAAKSRAALSVRLSRAPSKQTQEAPSEQSD